MKNRTNKPKHWGKFTPPLEKRNFDCLNANEKKILERKKLKLEDKRKKK